MKLDELTMPAGFECWLTDAQEHFIAGCRAYFDGIHGIPVLPTKYAFAFYQIGYEYAHYKSTEFCEWTRRKNGIYITSCKHTGKFVTYDVKLNFVFCPYCGKQIKEVTE
jgi:hypothetical protein